MAGDSDISPFEVVLNCFIVVACTAIAHYANVCLLLRDDRAHRSALTIPNIANINDRIVSGNKQRYGSQLGGTPTLAATAAPSSLPPPLAPPSLSGAVSTASSESMARLVNPPPSRRRSSILYGGQQGHHPSHNSNIETASSQNGIPSGGENDSFVGAGNGSLVDYVQSLFAVRSLVFADLRSLFFILVIISCATQATTMLVLTFAKSKSLRMTGNRRVQDIITVPQACSIFCVFAALLNILYKLASEGSLARHYRARPFLSIIFIIGAYVVTLVLLVLDRWPLATEYLSSSLEVLFSLLFLLASVVLPNMVLSLGDELISVGAKIRKVSILISICLVARFIVLFPQMQDQYGKDSNFSKYAVPLFQFVGMVPMIGSLYILHQH